MSQENIRRRHEKILDEWKDILTDEITDLGKDFIRQNTRTVIDVAVNIAKEVISIFKTPSKPNGKSENDLRDLINKAVAEGCEIGYQAGRTQKTQLFVYGLTKYGLDRTQIRQVLDIIKKSEDEFIESYKTYEQYVEMTQVITNHI